ncbi:MAG: hypothetical protein H6625_14290 [Bdellovibrionaceae bacterium]|nr:hypothetical protein [Pseudobdellovibrionaceae bacterium]
MKSIIFSLTLLLVAGSTALACPDAGKVFLEYKGNKVGYVDEYNAKLVVLEGYSLEFLNTKGSDEEDGADIIDDTGAWVWLCDQRSGIDDQYRSERVFCSDMKKDVDGAYVLDSWYYGLRDFHISVTSDSDDKVSLVYKVEEANIDPNQPRARGGCGRTVSL